MTDGVVRSVDAAKSAQEVFTDISKSSSETLGYSEGILALSQDQTEKIKNVVSITESIVVIAEQTASGAEEVASSASEMNLGMQEYMEKSKHLREISSRLQSNLQRFKLNKDVVRE